MSCKTVNVFPTPQRSGHVIPLSKPRIMAGQPTPPERIPLRNKGLIRPC